MSEYISSYRSSRGPQARNPNSYDPNVKIIKLGKQPRIYDSAISPLQEGMYVYPKPGEIIFYYSDFNGVQRQPKGKSQVQEPKREGNELVGKATGRAEKGTNGIFIEVSWVNSYKDHNWPKPDVMVYEQRVGWVDSSRVEWQKDYVAPEQKGVDAISEPEPDYDKGGGGIDITTFGYLAIGAALLFRIKKRGKK